MNNFTTNTYELKREICNFSEKIANGTSKPVKKFVMETQYGFAKGGSCLISNMARALDEDIKLNYTIDCVLILPIWMMSMKKLYGEII